MSFLRNLTLLLQGRAAIVSMEPVVLETERLSVEMTFNRTTHERRVITNMSHTTAVDVRTDLQRSATLEGSHAVALALGDVLDRSLQ